MLTPLKHQAGINLVEVLVTVVITSIGLLGLSSLQLQANRSTFDSGNRSQALWILEDLTNRIRANAVALDDYDTGNAAVQCNALPAKMCMSYHSGSNRVSSNSTCTNAELAHFDLWEVACGLNSNVAGSVTTRASAAHFIANPTLSVQVNNDRSVSLTLEWDTRTVGTDAAGNTIYSNKSGNIQAMRSSLTSVMQP